MIKRQLHTVRGSVEFIFAAKNCGISSVTFFIRVSEANPGSRYEEFVFVNKLLSLYPISNKSKCLYFWLPRDW